MKPWGEYQLDTGPFPAAVGLMLRAATSRLDSAPIAARDDGALCRMANAIG